MAMYCMANALGELIDHRHGIGYHRLVAGAIEGELSPRARELRQYDRGTFAQVVLVFDECLIVQRHHRHVERQHGLFGNCATVGRALVGEQSAELRNAVANEGRDRAL
jgi:hypothetical protein